MSDDNKRLPPSKYAAQYPLNQVHVSRSGHERHVDDTPGAERIREAHKSGTYWEVGPDGRSVTLIVSDEYHYVKGGLTLTVENNMDVRVAGNMRLIIEGDCYAEVHGDLSSVVSGDSTVATLGDSVNMTAGDAYTKVQGNASISTDGNLNADVGKDAEISVKGDSALISEGDVAVEGKKIYVDGSGDVKIKSSGKIKMEASSVEVNCDITTTGDVKAGDITLKTHKHTGVQTGSGTTGTPTS